MVLTERRGLEGVRSYSKHGSGEDTWVRVGRATRQIEWQRERGYERECGSAWREVDRDRDFQALTRGVQDYRQREICSEHARGRGRRGTRSARGPRGSRHGGTGSRTSSSVGMLRLPSDAQTPDNSRQARGPDQRRPRLPPRVPQCLWTQKYNDIPSRAGG